MAPAYGLTLRWQSVTAKGYRRQAVRLRSEGSRSLLFLPKSLRIVRLYVMVNRAYRSKPKLLRKALLEAKVRILRGKLFAHALADAAGCEHAGCALARWYERKHGLKRDKKRNKKWIAYFKGALPSKALQAELIREFPDLAAVLESSLWVALSADLTDKVNWDVLADEAAASLGLIKQRNLELLDIVMGYPRWEFLGALIIIVRAGDIRHVIARLTIQKKLASYLRVACLYPPLSYIAPALFERLNELVTASVLGGPFLAWPETSALFTRRVRRLRVLAGRAMQKRWVRSREPGAVMLMSLLLSDPKKYRPIILSLLQEDSTARCPRKLQSKLQRARQRHSGWLSGETVIRAGLKGRGA